MIAEYKNFLHIPDHSIHSIDHRGRAPKALGTTQCSGKHLARPNRGKQSNAEASGPGFIVEAGRNPKTIFGGIIKFVLLSNLQGPTRTQRHGIPGKQTQRVCRSTLSERMDTGSTNQSTATNKVCSWLRQDGILRKACRRQQHSRRACSRKLPLKVYYSRWADPLDLPAHLFIVNTHSHC